MAEALYGKFSITLACFDGWHLRQLSPILRQARANCRGGRRRQREFMDQDLGFRVWGLGFRVYSLEFGF
jgi:hypothetical protein